MKGYRIASKVLWSIWQTALVSTLLVGCAFVWRWVYALEESVSFVITAYLFVTVGVVLVVYHRRDLVVLSLGLAASALAAYLLLPAAGSQRTLVIWAGVLSCGGTWWLAHCLQRRMVQGLLDNPRLFRLRPLVARLPAELPAVLITLVGLSAGHALAQTAGFFVGLTAVLLLPVIVALCCFRSKEEALRAALILRKLTRKFPRGLRIAWVVVMSVATALSLGMPPTSSRGIWGSAARIAFTLLGSSSAATALIVAVLTAVAGGFERFARLIEGILKGSEQSELESQFDEILGE